MADTATQVNNLRNQIAEQKAELKRLEKIQKDLSKKRERVFKHFEKMNIMNETLEGLCWMWSKTKMNLKIVACNNDLTKIIKLIEGNGNNSQEIKEVFGIDISISRLTAKNVLSIEDFTFFINFFTGANFSQEEIEATFISIHPNLTKIECNVCGEEKRKCDMVVFCGNDKKRVCECKYDVCSNCGVKINPKKCVLCRTEYAKLKYI